jgi:glycosyltransferase involved in cell wall biosynthesis
MHDAIVASGWTWEASNVPERMASALARAGSRVLYCENPASFLRTVRPLAEVEKGVFALGLHHFGHRLNSLSILRPLQAKLLATEILNTATRLHLNDPVFIYPHGDYVLPLCREFKRRGFKLIHVCMDYELELLREHVRESDLALVIPDAAFKELREQFGTKVRRIPQFSYVDDSIGSPNGLLESPELSRIPKPRLGYLGGLTGRISLPLLGETLSRHPEWQFLSFDARKRLALANEHILPWRSREELSGVLAGLDAGFMPYDCAIPKNLHCVPLKLFDYFACGMPVVSTPITFLRGYEEMVYLGSTPDELAHAISQALIEPADSPKRAGRIALAREHSIGRSAQILAALLDELSTRP